MMTKEMLELEIDKLKKVVEQHEEQAKDLKNDLANAEQKLVDLDKPKLTSNQFEHLHDAIEQGVDEFDFDYADNYDLDLAMYDNCVEVERINFNETSNLASGIIEQVEKMFGVADESDDTDSSECSVPSEQSVMECPA